jgi:PAS domain S-box-containing protein
MSTILIAYEREMEQNALEKVLAERGHTVIRSSNGVDALETARRESPNLIISDISLPKMDGFSLCKKWKQDEHLQTVPFMFYTRRHNDPKYERFALELGVDRFVERTSDQTAFLSALDAVLADGAVARQADTMRLQALTTGSFLTTGKHLSTQSQLATTITTPALKTGSNGATAPNVDDRALAREARLLTKLAELDAQNKQLQTGEQRLRDSLDTQMRTATHIADTYGALQVAAADGFWLLEENDRIRDTNESYCRLSGYSKEELLKLKATDLDMRWRDDAATHSEVLRDEGQIRYQTQHRRKDGSLFDVELSIGSVTGAQARRLVIIRDVTTRARRNEVAKRLERTKDAALEIFAATESWDESTLSRRAAELAASLSESPLAYLCLYDAARQSASMLATFEAGGAAVSANTEHRALPTGPWSECARSGKPQLIDDMTNVERIPGLPAQHRAVFIPVGFSDGMTAVLCAANRATAYSENDCAMLAPLANATGAALRAKHSHVQTLMSSQRAEVALQGAIEAISRMVERHDPHATGVSWRVASLAVALARELGLPQRDQNTLRTSALLHRVGCIAIPSALLNRPGELTPVELALVRTHVEESYKILSEIEFGAPVAEIVHQHQERLDGSGYPRGLRGEQISIEARVLAVADLVVSTAHKQSGGANIENALTQIESGAGTLFDDRVTQACVKLFREQGFTLPA